VTDTANCADAPDLFIAHPRRGYSDRYFSSTFSGSRRVDPAFVTDTGESRFVNGTPTAMDEFMPHEYKSVAGLIRPKMLEPGRR
jgi:hypothetical protein